MIIIAYGNDEMNLNHLRIFHATAKLQSFTRASKELYLTQPGISKHIKQLEEYYGIRLFDRLGKKVVLTQAGEILFETTQSVFELLLVTETRINELKGLTGGKLTIGASVTIGTYIIPGVLANFRRKYPRVELALEISLSQAIAEKILDNTLDVGLVGHQINDERLISRKFLTDELIVLVSPSHRWASRETIRPGELIDEPFLLARQGSGTRKTLQAQLNSAGVMPKKVVEFGNTVSVKTAIETGLGISILSKYAVSKEINAGLLKAIRLSRLNLKRNFYFIYRKDKYLANAVKAFLSLLEGLNRSDVDLSSQLERY